MIAWKLRTGACSNKANKMMLNIICAEKVQISKLSAKIVFDSLFAGAWFDLVQVLTGYVFRWSVLPVVCSLQQDGFINVIICTERSLEHLHDAPLPRVLNKSKWSDWIYRHTLRHSITYHLFIYTCRIYLRVEAWIQCIVWEVWLRQTHLLQNIHFFLDHWPGSIHE